jgi:integrase/recombinase XerD
MEEMKLQQFAEKLELLGYSKRVIKDYPALLRLFFKYLEKEENIQALANITTEHITGYHCFLQYTKHRKDIYLSTNTIRSRLGAVKTFFTLMHEEGIIEKDLGKQVTVPKRKKDLPRHVPSEQDMKILLDSIETKNPITTRDKAMLELLYATGIRNEELRTCTIDNLDVQEKTLFITGKGSKDRVVPVGDWVLPYLMEYLAIARPRFLKQQSPTALLFISKNGRLLTEGNLCDLVHKYAIKAGLFYTITPHSFRHACGTHLLKAGADIRYVQELLGHADLSSTQIYTKLDLTFLKKAHTKFHPRQRDHDAE